MVLLPSGVRGGANPKLPFSPPPTKEAYLSFKQASVFAAEFLKLGALKIRCLYI